MNSNTNEFIEAKAGAKDSFALESDSGKLTYEQSIERLEKIVARLENEATPLSESLTLFQEGIQLAKRCEAELQSMEEKVQMLLQSDDGELSVQSLQGNENVK